MESTQKPLRFYSVEIKGNPDALLDWLNRTLEDNEFVVSIEFVTWRSQNASPEQGYRVTIDRVPG